MVREITVASELNTTAKPHKKKINWKGVVQIQIYAINSKKFFKVSFFLNWFKKFQFFNFITLNRKANIRRKIQEKSERN